MGKKSRQGPDKEQEGREARFFERPPCFSSSRDPEGVLMGTGQ